MKIKLESTNSHQFILCILFLFWSGGAYAYLDPGSGSALLQGIVAAAIGVIAYVKIGWKHTLYMIKRFFGKNEKKS